MGLNASLDNREDFLYADSSANGTAVNLLVISGAALTAWRRAILIDSLLVLAVLPP